MILKWMVFLLMTINFTHGATGECERILKEKTGTFKSPNETEIKHIFNGSTYRCKWKILLSAGIVKLRFKYFAVGVNQILEKCNPEFSITITDMSDQSSGQPKETMLCGAKPPPVFYSKGSSIIVTLNGYLSGPANSIASFEALYESVNTTPTESKKCGPCGGYLVKDSGVIRSPNYPGVYPDNCDCKWSVTVRKNYFVKFKFWSFSLEKSKNHVCHDYLMIFDGSSASSKSLGKFCGDNSPGLLQTTGRNAYVHFHSDFSNSAKGFEVLFQSAKDDSDLSSLRSIAAILGGVSFGIFVFLLLCSVIYKKYVNTDNNRNSCPNQTSPENDYLDAVQAAAPPSYQAVMADPEHYPRTPEVTPSGSPDVTPSLLRRNIIRPVPYIHDDSQHLESLPEDTDSEDESPPPPYPGNVEQQTEDEDVLIKDLPPPPTYEMVSDSEDHGDSLSTWDPIGPRREPRLTADESRYSDSNTILSDSLHNNAPSSRDGCSVAEDQQTLTSELPASSRDGGDIDDVPSTTRTRTLRRRSSDSGIHERLLSQNGNIDNIPQRYSLRRRYFSSGFQTSELLTNSQPANADDRLLQTLTVDSDEAAMLGTNNQRASSAPCFSNRQQRGQASDSAECNDSNQRCSNINSPIVRVRTLIARHGHSNRVEPDVQAATSLGNETTLPEAS